MDKLPKFIPGIWYKCNYNGEYFRFVGLKPDGAGGVYTDAEYHIARGLREVPS